MLQGLKLWLAFSGPTSIKFSDISSHYQARSVPPLPEFVLFEELNISFYSLTYVSYFFWRSLLIASRVFLSAKAKYGCRSFFKS